MPILNKKSGFASNLGDNLALLIKEAQFKPFGSHAVERRIKIDGRAFLTGVCLELRQLAIGLNGVKSYRPGIGAKAAGGQPDLRAEQVTAAGRKLIDFNTPGSGRAV